MHRNKNYDIILYYIILYYIIIILYYIILYYIILYYIISYYYIILYYIILYYIILYYIILYYIDAFTSVPGFNSKFGLAANDDESVWDFFFHLPLCTPIDRKQLRR